MDDPESRIRSVLERHEDVLAAYLFGSVARGTAAPLSDVDVAVLLREDGNLVHRQRDLITDLSRELRRDDVDVIVLNTCPVALGYRVLRDGRVLVSRDEKARVDHWVRTVDRYIDMAPLRRALDEGLHHRLEEGRFGRS
ncbi:MAG: nucleotidyltransferase domain-containing protein [Actinomycetota bacterium]|nr:nucleotidyltransferase domain-containing protein [Actinomycetota bacterium]